MNKYQEEAQKLGLSLQGICETCKKAEGNRVFPQIDDIKTAIRMSYISCGECFAAVWAGEN